MKRIIFVILIAVFAMTSALPNVVNAFPVYEQRDDKKTKNPPGPPVVRPKEKDNKPSDNRPRGGDDKPKKGKKPGNE